MEKDYELLLEEIRRLKEDNERLKGEYEKLGKMYDDLSLSYEDALLLYDRAKESIRIESELQVARNIQMSMVPNRFPELPEIDLYALMAPAKEVGGDLYDFFLLGRMLYFCIGDVSGKGVPASLFMAVTRVLFRHIAAQQVSPAEIAQKINVSLSQMNDNNMFVTMFIGRADFDTGRLDFCNCGHNPAVFIDKGDKASLMESQYKNMPLGVFGDFGFKEESIGNIRDRQLLLYTDGLNEAMNPKHEEFGNDRLLTLMNGGWGKSAHEVIDMLHDAVETFRDGAEPNDDLTMMCLKLRS